jgi:CxxC-x17-CxxC domain-containing protein
LDARSLTCVECGAEFEFSAEEQQHFETRGFTPPKRCRPCRAEKRRRQPDRPAPRAAASRPAPPSHDKPRGPLNPTTCTVCGAATEVPFLPDGVRPVYCLPCLKQRTR